MHNDEAQSSNAYASGDIQVVGADKPAIHG